MTEPLGRFVQRTCIGCFAVKVDVRVGSRACGDELRCENCKSKKSSTGAADKQAERVKSENHEGLYPSFIPYIPR